MRVGFTYDLRDGYLARGFSEEQAAEFDRPDTIEAIEHALRAAGHRVDRIGGLESLMRRLLAGDRWDLVFNIAEGVQGIGRESQVPALLDAWNIPYVFSDPVVLGLCLHKGLAKHVARDAGVPTPDFVMVESRADVDHIHLPFPLFAKPVAEGTSKGIDGRAIIRDRAGLERACARLLSGFAQPVLVERYLPGREFTAGLLGTGDHARVLGVLEVALTDRAEPDVYTWMNKEEFDVRVDYRLVDDADSRAAGAVALAAWRALGCRDGGRVDVRLDGSGEAQFMEVNPLPGLNPVRSDLAILATKLGWPFERLIASIVDSAMTRVPAVQKSALKSA